ncbi:MAG TPA: ABC transporter permease [Phycisphaerae bacterium]|nr:ABC transporter permease [Phycisphaerae bacterium]
MTLTYVLMQNLRRNRLRTALTCMAFALPMGIFVAAISLVVGLREMQAANEKQLRLAVHHKVTLINLLPEGMRRKIEALDPDKRRIATVCGMRWFGGQRENSQNTIQTLASDTDTFPAAFSEIGMTQGEVEQWQRERRAALVGGNLAREFAWKVGDRVTLKSSIPPYLALDFIVIKIMDDESKANLLYFRRDYLEDSLKEANFPVSGCNIFWVKCNDAAALATMQREIDAAFANSPDETVSEDENAFINNFIQGTGNIPGLIQAISIVVVFIITMIGGNTVMMSFRERIAELAVFKAIGFRSNRVFLLVLAESVLLALLGSLLGIVPVTVVLTAFPVRGLFLGGIGKVTVSPTGVVGALMMAVMIGVFAGLWPALRALRLRTVDALRTM